MFSSSFISVFSRRIDQVLMDSFRCRNMYPNRTGGNYVASDVGDLFSTAPGSVQCRISCLPLISKSGRHQLLGPHRHGSLTCSCFTVRRRQQPFVLPNLLCSCRPNRWSEADQVTGLVLSNVSKKSSPRRGPSHLFTLLTSS